MTRRRSIPALAQTSDNGTTYWSARDLANVVGYTTWQRFATPLDRAMTTATNMGMDVDGNFNRSVKVSGSRGPAAVDYHLTREAAYLTMMNCDPHMDQVAAAQAYFAQSALIREGHMEDPDPQPSAAAATGVPVIIAVEP